MGYSNSDIKSILSEVRKKTGAAFDPLLVMEVHHLEDIGDCTLLIVDHIVIDVNYRIGWYLIHENSGRVIDRGEEMIAHPMTLGIEDSSRLMTGFVKKTVNIAKDKALGIMEVESWLTEELQS